MLHNDSPHTGSATKRDGMEDGAEWRHHSQALQESLQGGELGGTLQLINYTASVRGDRRMCPAAESASVVKVLSSD